MLEKIKMPTEININAQVTGRLWWPQDKVEFPVYKTFHKGAVSAFQNEYTGLRDALLDLQSSGDYQNLSFCSDVEVTLEHKTVFIDRNSRRVVKECTKYRTFRITPDNPEYKDLFE
jgi:hypothetical protein